jgi:hypothetical protein
MVYGRHQSLKPRRTVAQVPVELGPPDVFLQPRAL